MVYGKLSPQRPGVLPFLILIIVAIILLVSLTSALSNVFMSDTTAAPLSAVNPGRWPLAFVPNGGQSDSAVRYQAHLPGANLFFTKNGLTVGWAGGGIRLNFLGTSSSLSINGREAQPGIVNYMLAANANSWQTGLPTYGVVTYEELYPGITLAFNGQGNQMAAAFHIEPGADPAQIGWAFDWAEPVVGENGTLQLLPDEGTAETAVTISPPQAWQDMDGRNVAVTAAFRLDENGRVGLELGEFDGGLPLTVSAVFNYTPPGGSGSNDIITDVTVTPSGEVYVIGRTNAPLFHLLNPYQPENSGGWGDVFINAFSADGQSLIYGTFLGGSGDEWPNNSIAVTDNGRVYVTGETTSADFPLVNAYQPNYGGGLFGDTFVAVLAPNGQSLIFSTFLGGDDNDRPGDIAADGNGRVYVVGRTESDDFPLVNPLRSTFEGLNEAYVSVFEPDGQSLVYSTFLGGIENENAEAITVDDNGRAFVGGFSNSADFPLVNPIQPTIGTPSDGFVTIIAPDGQSLEYSTFLGGNDNDSVSGIEIDGNSRVYIVGSTESTDFPVVNPFQPTSGGNRDVFLTVFAADGQSFDFSTYFGGLDNDQASGIGLDGNGRVYLTGTTSSLNFPLANPIQSTLNSSSDSFVVAFLPGGQSLVYSTYLGGDDSDRAVGIAIDGNGRAYIAGRTESTDFPLVNPFQPTYGGGNDGFITAFNEDGQSLEYSTYLHGWYPGPTDVTVSELGQTAELTPMPYFLALGLLALLLLGVWLVTRSRH